MCCAPMRDVLVLMSHDTKSCIPGHVSQTRSLLACYTDVGSHAAVSGRLVSQDIALSTLNINMSHHELLLLQRKRGSVAETRTKQMRT